MWLLKQNKLSSMCAQIMPSTVELMTDRLMEDRSMGYSRRWTSVHQWCSLRLDLFMWQERGWHGWVLSSQCSSHSLSSKSDDWIQEDFSKDWNFFPGTSTYTWVRKRLHRPLLNTYILDNEKIGVCYEIPTRSHKYEIHLHM